MTDDAIWYMVVALPQVTQDEVPKCELWVGQGLYPTKVGPVAVVIFRQEPLHAATTHHPFQAVQGTQLSNRPMQASLVRSQHEPISQSSAWRI